MKLHADSHVDHGLSRAQVDYLLERFAGRTAFFVETIELPAELGTVSCDLVGPVVGDPVVPEDEVSYLVRGARTWRSRTVARAPRRSRRITVIGGPHGGEPCVLFTAYGGPPAPQEPGDPSCRDGAASRAFWSQHALIAPSGA